MRVAITQVASYFHSTENLLLHLTSPWVWNICLMAWPFLGPDFQTYDVNKAIALLARTQDGLTLTENRVIWKGPTWVFVRGFPAGNLGLTPQGRLHYCIWNSKLRVSKAHKCIGSLLLCPSVAYYGVWSIMLKDVLNWKAGIKGLLTTESNVF